MKVNVYSYVVDGVGGVQQVVKGQTGSGCKNKGVSAGQVIRKPRPFECRTQLQSLLLVRCPIRRGEEVC